MKSAKPQLAMPPELMSYLCSHMNPADVLAATLVTTDTVPETTRPDTFLPRGEKTTRPLDVWISYIPRRRSWTAHRDGLPEIAAPSLPELRALLAEACGGASAALSWSSI